MLDPETQRRFDEALSATRALSGARDAAKWNVAERAVVALLRSVGLNEHVPQVGDRIVPFTDREIVRARDLTPLQREVATLMAHERDMPLGRCPMPSTAWARRRWLGIDPPGLLFREDADGSTLYERLRAAKRRSEDEARTMIAAVPLRERLELLFDLRLAMGDYWVMHTEGMLFAAAQEVDASFGDVGRRLADRIEAALADPPAYSPIRVDSYDLRLAAYVPLVRAKIPIEPRWDGLLVLHGSFSAAFTDELIDAIPEERRAAAVVRALGTMMFDNDAVTLAASLLARRPWGEIASFALARVDKAWRPKEVLAAVKAAAKKSPEVAAALEAYEKARGPVPELVLAQRDRLETLGALGAREKTQLEISENRYGGRAASAEEILARSPDDDVEEAIAPSTLERVRFDDAKGPVIEGWFYMGDSGTLFRAGTTELVAERVQAGIECADTNLRLAIVGAIGAAAKAKAKAKKPAASKTKAKKPAASKTTAKAKAKAKAKKAP